MSYCRWSSDQYQCDLYVYADVKGGYTTHVASYRRVRRPESPDPFVGQLFSDLRDDPEKWQAAYNKFMGEIKVIPSEPIGLPHDGESFNDATVEELEERLEYLKEVGYQFPEYVFEMLEEEKEEC